MPVYFMRIGKGRDEVIKIGHSEDVELRAKTLRSARKTRVVVLGILPGARREEVQHHRLFSHLRIGRRENFRPEPELMEYIRTNARPIESVKSNTVKVKVDRRILCKAKCLAAYEKTPLSDYLCGILRPLVDRELLRILKDMP